MEATVLIVDDNEPLRRLMVRALAQAGFAVLQAPSADIAIALSKRSPEPPRLLVTDLSMPGMGGRELAAYLIDINPEIRVLFISGAGSVDCGEFIAKPFSPSELVSRVRAMFAAAGA